MTFLNLWNDWNSFLFKPQSPLPMAIFRILFGVLILQFALVHVDGDLLFWYGKNGITSIDAIKQYWWHNVPHFDLLLLFSSSDNWVRAFFAVFLTASVFLTLGLFTRYSAIIVCLGLISLHNHQPFNINGGDAMLRFYSMYLMFAPSGEAISLDRLIHHFRKGDINEPLTPPPVAPWAMRLVQLQLAVSYADTFFCKITGNQWLTGSAVYYATRLDDMMRLRMSFLFDNFLFCKLLSWYTLVVELAMWTLVWFRDLKYWVLLAALILHAGIDLAINLPVFEYAFVIGFVTFIDAEDLAKCMSLVRKLALRSFGEQRTLVYNSQSVLSRRAARVVESLDPLKVFKIEDCHATQGASDKFAAAAPLLWLQGQGKIVSAAIKLLSGLLNMTTKAIPTPDLNP